jgi:hypothetical protein
MDNLSSTHPVFGILSYGLFWKFFCLDTHGVVYSGGPGILIDRPPHGFHHSIGLKHILAWIIWILDSFSYNTLQIEKSLR